MNVYESVWMYMKQCLKICDGIGMFMMDYGCMSAIMDVYESIYWYMNVNGSK